MFDHAGKAALAAATAASTSALLAKQTEPVTAPVAGLVTSWRRLELPGGHLAIDDVADRRDI